MAVHFRTETHLWITFIVVTCYLVLLPMWVMIVLRNEYTRPVLKSGWVPVLSALCISGYVLRTNNNWELRTAHSGKSIRFDWIELSNLRDNKIGVP